MNQSEFVLLISPFKDKVFRLAKRLLLSKEEAEDATQEVLTKLWSKNDSLSKYHSVEAFAMTMAKNYCLDQLKSKRASNEPLIHSNYADTSPSLEKKIEYQDSLMWVDTCLAQLPEQQRMIVQLRDVEQYEFEEIASLLQMKESAVRVSLSRARKIIREYIIKHQTHGNQ
jgi:RNA polymerase sigma-70 factor (ECF subfamily)